MGDPCAALGLPGQQQNIPVVKGASVRMWDRPQATAVLSDKAVDCSLFNAASVEVIVTGMNPSATLTVKGASAQGGNFLALPDPNATQMITSNTIFDVVVGQQWLKVELSNISGTFGNGQGFMVIVTPYNSPGQTRLNVTVGTEPSGSGEYTTATSTTINVATTSTIALASNANRLYALFVNNSDDTDIYLMIGNDAVVGQGIRLNMGGGSYEVSKKLGNLTTAIVKAIHGGTGTKQLLVVEGV